MTEAFTTQWAEALTERLGGMGAGPGGSGIVEWVISGGDPDRVWARWAVEDGRVGSVAISDSTVKEAEVSVPLTRAQAEAVLAGDVDPAQAFMRGDLKPEGSSRAWFALLSALARADHRQALAA